MAPRAAARGGILGGDRLFRVPHDRQPHLRLHAVAARARDGGEADDGARRRRRGMGAGIHRAAASRVSLSGRARGAAPGRTAGHRPARVRVRARPDPRRAREAAPKARSRLTARTVDPVGAQPSWRSRL